MVRLRVYSQTLLASGDFDTSTEVVLDLFEGVDIPTTKQFTDLTSVQEVSGTYSKNFKVPNTPTNAAYFGYFNEPTSENTDKFNPKKKAPAILDNGGLVIVYGSLQLVHATTEYFEVRLFGDTVTLFRSIANKMLTDYDWSDYDHQLTVANEELKDGMGEDGLFDGDIRYGIVDYGEQWTGDDMCSTVYCPWFKMFKPMVRLSTIFNKIVNDAGFKVVGNDIKEIMDERYVLWHKSGATLQPEENPAWYESGTNSTSQSVSALGWNVIQFDTAVDTENIFTPLDYGFNLPPEAVAGQPGYPEFEWQFQLRLKISTSISTTISVKVGNQVQNLLAIPSLTDYVITFGATSWIGSAPFTPTLVVAEIRKTSFSASVAVEPDSIFKIVKAPTMQIEPEVDMNLNTPLIAASDVVKYVLTKYCCVVIPSLTNTKELEITPFALWENQGDVIDWTNKVDYMKEIVTEPTTSLEAKQLILTDKLGNDLLSQTYKTTANRTYGQRTLINTDNDFATSEQKIETAAMSTPLNLVQGTNMVIPRLYDNNGATVEGALRVFRFGGVFAHQTWYTRTLNSVVEMNSWPYFGNYEEPYPAADSNIEDDNFGVDTPYYPVDKYPTLTAYELWWSSYVEQLYSPSARIYTMYVYLNRLEYYAIKFNERIMIKNAMYRVLSIENFQNITDQSTKVKLLKIDPLTVDVEYRPCFGIAVTNVLPNGKMVYTGTMTKRCCHSLGGWWQSATQDCWKERPPSNPNPPVLPGGSEHITNASIMYGSDYRNAVGQGIGAEVTTDNQRVWGIHPGAQTVEAGAFAFIEFATSDEWLDVDPVDGFKIPQNSTFMGKALVSAMSSIGYPSTAILDFTFSTDSAGEIIPMGSPPYWVIDLDTGGMSEITLDLAPTANNMGMRIKVIENSTFVKGQAALQITGVIIRTQKEPV